MARNVMYSILVAESPQVARIYDTLAIEGPLDAKTRRLVKIAVAAGLASEGAVRHHAHKAVHEGVPLDEVRHAIALALTIAGQDATQAVRWVEEATACNGNGHASGMAVPTIGRDHRGDLQSQRQKIEFESFKRVIASARA